MMQFNPQKYLSQIQQQKQQADFYYNTGITVDDKSKGLPILFNAIKIYDLLIAATNDKFQKDGYQSSKNLDQKLLEDRLKFLEDQKSGKTQQVMTTQNTAGGKTKDGKDGKDDSEKNKFKEMLSEAIVREKPNIKWTDIAGLNEAKKAIQEAVVLPIKFPDFFKGVRQPWKGILLYGPPGTGKTFMAKACATETDGTFFSCSSSDLVSKFVGESEKLIKTLFQMAREEGPAIIFIDEIDSLCGARGDGQNEASQRIKTEFLVQMEGVGHKDKGLLVLAATNLPWTIDPAMRRRFQKRIYIPLPDTEARLFLIKHNLKSGLAHTLVENDYQILAEKTNGFSGSDITIFVRDAVMQPIRKIQNCTHFVLVNGKYRPANPSDQGAVQKTIYDLDSNQVDLPSITMEDFLDSLKKCKPSVSQDSLKEYVEWTQQYGQEG